MNIYTATCDAYDHLLAGFAHQFNRYWGSEQSVTVLGFRHPPVPLPANFIFHQLEPVETRAWTTNLRLFFESIGDTHFTFLLDDYWLIDPVDLRQVSRMESIVLEGAVKGDLSTNTAHFAHHDLGNGLVEATQDALYRTSTQPCIWNRQFMLSLLQEDLNPWQFELQDNPAIQDGRIIGTRKQIYRYANVYFKGSPHHMIDLISPDDRRELERTGAFTAMPGYTPLP